MSDKKWTTVEAAEDVTEEILNIAELICDGWYSEGRIDWEDFIDRMENHTLNNGTELDMGADVLSPAIQKIKKHIREYRKS